VLFIEINLTAMKHHSPAICECQNYGLPLDKGKRALP